MIWITLLHLQEELELESLKQSADLYAELYAEEAEYHELTESSIAEWPE